MKNAEEKIAAELAHRRIKKEISEIDAEISAFKNEAQQTEKARFLSRLILFIGGIGILLFILWGNWLFFLLIGSIAFLIVFYPHLNNKNSLETVAKDSIKLLSDRRQHLEKQLSEQSAIINQ